MKVIFVLLFFILSYFAVYSVNAADITATLDSSDGSSSFSFQDSTNAEIGYIDSDGNIMINGGMRIDSGGVPCTTSEMLIVDGKIGIGNTNPLDSLHITNGMIRISSAAPIIRFEETDQSDDKWYMVMDGTTLGFRHGTTGDYPGPIQMTADGDVGINTGNPSATLEVNGTFKCTKTIQGGEETNGAGWISVTYPTAFNSTPIVVATPRREDGTSTEHFVMIRSITATGFQFYTYNHSGTDHTSANDFVDWIAFVP